MSEKTPLKLSEDSINISRRGFFTLLSALGVSQAVLSQSSWAQDINLEEITEADLEIAEKLIGLKFTDQDRKLMLRGINSRIKAMRIYARLKWTILLLPL